MLGNYRRTEGASKSLLFHYFLNKKELYLYLWKHAGRIFHEAAGKGHTQTTDFFEIICQRVLANCVFMREAPTIYLFALRALFEENPEINGYLLSCYWQMFLSGELAPAFLEKDILKRTGQWRMVYLKERND